MTCFYKFCFYQIRLWTADKGENENNEWYTNEYALGCSNIWDVDDLLFCEYKLVWLIIYLLQDFSNFPYLRLITSREGYKVENSVLKKLAIQYFPRFGNIAVHMGFVTAKQLKQAMVQQVEDDIFNRPHRLIGEILLENGWITDEQINTVLNEIFKGHD